MQKVFVDGCEALLVHFENGKNFIYQQSGNKVICNPANDCNAYKCIGKKCEINNMDKGYIEHKFDKANNENIQGKNDNCVDGCLNKLEHKKKKLNLQKANYFEFYTVGIVIGD